MSSDVDAGRHDLAVLDPGEVPELPHLAEVVVPAREMEQEVPDGPHAEALSDPPEDARARNARGGDRLVEEGLAGERGLCGGRLSARRGLRPAIPAARSPRSRCRHGADDPALPHPAYSAEIR